NHGRLVRKQLIMNPRRWRATAVRFVRIAQRNPDCSSACYADFANMVMRADVRHDCLRLLSSACVGDDAPATKYDTLDSLNDHRGDRDKSYGSRIDILEW